MPREQTVESEANCKFVKVKGLDLLEEILVLYDLKTGKLSSLAGYLRLGGRELSPEILTAVADLIDGSSEVTDFRLKVVKHPGLHNRDGGKMARYYADMRARCIAFCVGVESELAGGLMKVGYSKAVEEFGVGLTYVKECWGRHKDDPSFNEVVALRVAIRRRARSD